MRPLQDDLDRCHRPATRRDKPACLTADEQDAIKACIMRLNRELIGMEDHWQRVWEGRLNQLRDLVGWTRP